VLLDRSDNTETELSSANKSEVLRRIIIQNFARTQHADRILQILNFLASTVPLYKLSYSNAESAARELKRAFEGGDGLAEKVLGMSHLPDVTRDDPDQMSSEAIDFERPIMRAPTASELLVDDQRFVVDAQGFAIHQLNPISGAVWTALETPTTRQDIFDMFGTAFPDQSPEKIENDIGWVLRVFAARRLLQQAV
jgi:hypothetical protein